MKSILRQLKKYQPKPQPIEKPEEDPTSTDLQISGDRIEDAVANTGLSKKDVTGAPVGIWADTLYPHELDIIYYWVRKGRYIENVEKKCDDFLKDFMGRQNPNQYIQIFKQAMNPRVKRLTMLRVLLASFGFGEKPGDNVIETYRQTAKKFLQIKGEITQEEAHRMIESEHKYADTSEQILGRIGYLIIWKDLNAINILLQGELDFQP